MAGGRRWFWLGSTAVAVVVIALLGLSAGQPARRQAVEPLSATPSPAPTITPLVMPPVQTRESWVTLPEMPPDATQADYGAEIYRLVCSTCHGDVGQGLTEDWLATMAPENQNCWQSKCHASNHPVDGFTFPKYVPPLVGDNIVTRYGTAADIYTFIRHNMPYQAPGDLLEEEYWQLTAFILRLNGYDADGTMLDAGSAAAFTLR